MKTSTILLVPAMATALSMALGGGAQAGPEPGPKFEPEECSCLREDAGLVIARSRR